MFENFATVITALLQKRFNFDIIMYGPLRDLIITVCGHIFGEDISFSSYFEMISWVHIIFILCIIVVASVIYYKKSLSKSWSMTEKNVILIIENHYLRIFRNTFLNYIQYFDLKKYSYGNYEENDDEIAVFGGIQTVVDEKVEFDLPIIGKGYVYARKQSQTRNEGDKEFQCVRMYYEVHCTNPRYDFRSFMDDCKKLNDQADEERNKKTVVLKSYKIFYYSSKDGTSFESREYYKQDISIYESYMKTWWNDLFIDIQPILSYINENVEKRQVNILLHGPPGTGKSNTIYKLGVWLKRNIISIDLRYFDKSKMYTTLQSFNSSFGISGENIIVLEEFDNALDFFKKREEHKTYKYESYTPTVKNDEKDKKSDDAFTSWEAFSSDSKTRIHSTDLLEAFQGPVPVPGCIVIATTNHFDRISYEHSALFRFGRMTPFYIGFMDQSQFVRLCQYYFSCEPDIQLPKDHSISTAEINEIAKQCHGDYTIFVKQLLQRISCAASSSSK